MILIKPSVINDAALTASNMPEADAAEWSSVTAYTVGNAVMVTDDTVHKTYEALTSTTNHYPPDHTADVVGDVAAKWIETGSTNRWKMFDGTMGAGTAGNQPYTAADYNASDSVSGIDDGIAVAVTPSGVFNAVAAFGLTGVYLDVVLLQDAVVTYSKRVPLLDELGSSTWYDYFFTEPVKRNDVVLLDLPKGGGELRVSVYAPTADCEIGELIVGTQVEVGVATYGSNIGIRDYSIKETDDFGRTKIVERAFAKRAEYDVKILSSRLATVQRILSEYRAKPLVWVGADGMEETYVYGYYRDYRINITGPIYSDATIEVEGLT